jgi:hypothetical protein
MQIGTLGVVVEKSDGRATAVGSGADLELSLWAYDRGLVDPTRSCLVVDEVTDFERTLDVLRTIRRSIRYETRRDVADKLTVLPASFLTRSRGWWRPNCGAAKGRSGGGRALSERGVVRRRRTQSPMRTSERIKKTLGPTEPAKQRVLRCPNNRFRIPLRWSGAAANLQRLDGAREANRDVHGVAEGFESKL